VTYDEGWNGKWIHAPYGGEDPPSAPVTVQEQDRDERPVLYLVEKGSVKPLYRPPRRAGFRR